MTLGNIGILHFKEEQHYSMVSNAQSKIAVGSKFWRERILKKISHVIFKYFHAFTTYLKKSFLSRYSDLSKISVKK